MKEVWAAFEDGSWRLYSVRVNGGRKLKVVDMKQELLDEIDAFEETIYAPVRVYESKRLKTANPYVAVTKEAVKDMVECKGALWYLNRLGGGKGALLEPIDPPPPIAVG